MRIILMLALTAGSALAQLEGFTASVSRSVIVPAEEAVFQITASARLDVSEQQVATALAEFGVTSKDLVQVGVESAFVFGGLTPSPRASYIFLITVPYARWRELALKLSDATRKPPEAINTLQFNAAAQSTTKAVDDARQRLLPEMLAEARRKAELLAQAAGVGLGAIEGISETYSPLSLPAATSILGAVGVSPGSVLSQQTTFNLFVRFRPEGRS